MTESGDPIRDLTLVDLLRRRARQHPRRRLYTFLADGEREEEGLTYGELAARARAVARELRRAGLAGERAVLLYPPGLDFVVAFSGCLWAGVVAVPAYPPGSRRTLPRLASILRDARPAAVLTAGEASSRWQSLTADLPEMAGVRWLAIDGRSAGTGEVGAEPPAPSPDDLAFLQYTSGSTSEPKGVKVTHANLMANEGMILRAFEQSAESVVVSWLPLYHDMGLIGGVLQPLYAGGRCVLMSPLAFLQRPRRWLEAISRYRATTSGGPNFAYELAVRKVGEEERRGLDLTSWRVAFDGAEPVRAETLERFAAAFAPCGFRREAFFPCYGLAEATLFVAGGEVAAAPRVERFAAAALEEHRAEADAGGRPLVGCGGGHWGQEVVIADPETARRCTDGTVGEIWVAGPAVAAGYWGRPEVSRRVFAAALAGEPSSGPYLRTGDLGFLSGGATSGGELYVTGRLKDLIILRGRNYYPQDVEATAEAAHPALHPGGGAAFAVEGEGEERLVVAWEVERRAAGDPELLAQVAESVRRAVGEVHEVGVEEVLLLRPGGIPKTSSGKVQRGRCRARFLAGELPVVARVGRGEEAGDEGEAALLASGVPLDREALAGLTAGERRRLVADLLCREVARVARLPVAELRPGEPLVGLGVDSLAAAELEQTLAARLGVSAPMAEILSGWDLASLERRVVEELEADLGGRRGEPPVAGARDEPVEEEVAGPEEEGAPSYGQRALWFLHRLAPDSGAYHILAAARVRPALEAGPFRRALARLAARHEALRTTFEAPEGEPRRRVHPPGEPDFQERPAAGWSDGELARAVAEEAYRPFDLEAGPLLRVRLFRCSPAADDLVLFAVHHIVADFWTLSILARELGLLYAAAREGREAELPPAPPSYGRFVAAERRRLARQGDELRRAWHRRLESFPRSLELPTDRPRPPVQTYRGAAVARRFNPAWKGELESLAGAAGATSFMALLAAFFGLLGRYTGQTDLLVGSPTAGRHRPEHAGLAGYCVNPVVLRGDLAGRPGLRLLLERVREVALEAFRHQGYPFPLLAEELQADRDPSRSPLFQVAFVLQKAQRPGEEALTAFALGLPGVSLELSGLTLESAALPERASPFDLTLRLAELEGGLAASLLYNPDLFDATTARRLLGHYEALLAAALAAPERPLAALPLLAPAEEAQLLREWNDTAAPYPWEVGLGERFAAQAERSPEAVAVVAEEGAGAFPGRAFPAHRTYRRLDDLSARLAGRLRAAGAAPEERIGVALERSAEAVVALLGVIRAGGAYVPVDPGQPPERVRLLLEECRCRLLVTAGEGFPAGGEACTAVPVPSLDEEAAPAAAPRPVAGGDQLAYVLFTSGSTGRPKGVAVPQRAVLRLVEGAGYILFGPRQVYLLLAPLAFDASTLELWGALLHGARLVVAPPGAPSLEALAGLLERHRVSTLWLTAGLFHLMVEERLEALAGVEQLLAGGEALSPPHVRRLLERRAPQVRWQRGAVLVNGYGPTENTTFTCCCRLRPEDGTATSMPIGRPIANGRVAVLDPGLLPVPAGVAGELYAGGDGLARGYQGRPAWTAERFVPDPVGRRRGDRLYRTGDRVRWRADGRLEFLGRLDDQVKIRGFRIEPGEVAAAVTELPQVREAVVLARRFTGGEPAAAPSGSGELSLVAYVVPQEGAELTPAALREALKEHLPDFMLPRFFAFLDEIPLTPNGKVDRRALPEPRLLAREGTVAPRTPVEEALAGLFRELLGVEEVGIEDGFFELGGHSLLATRLVSRLRQALGVELSVRAVFEAPSVAELAPRVEAALQGEGGEEAPPPLEPVSRDRPLPLSPAQERLWFLHTLDPGSAAYDIPVAVELDGPLAVPALAAALTALVDRHEVLRTTFMEVEGGPVQRIGPPAPVPLPVVDLAGLPPAAAEEELPRLARREARRPFDLYRGPVFRAALARLGPHRHGLLLTLHHVAGDGWSLAVVTAELSALYEARVRGRPARLPPLPVQYADYAAWQRRRLAGKDLERELELWRRRLAGAPPVLELPADRPRPPVQSYRGAVQPFTLPAELAGELAALGRRRGVTLFMLLLAAFDALLHRYTGAGEVVVGSPVASRTRREVEGLVGFFVNTLALRVELAGDPPFSRLLERVRRTTLEAYAHQELPFERLVEELAPQRSLAHSPLFQVLFALQTAPRAALALPELRVRRLPVDTGTAKFDLSVSLEESPGEEAGGQGLRGEVEYATDLFDATTVARLRRHYLTLLAGAAARPGTRLSELPLLTAAEAAQLAVEWNDTGAAASAPGLLHQPFRLRAAEQPEAVAVVGREERLTYGALEARAGALARRLADRGLGPEGRAGVLLPRCPELVTAILGVLMAGGAYVPLDPAYPAARRDFMLADSGASLLLVGTEEEAVGGEAGVPTVPVVGGPESQPAPPQAGRAPCPAGPDNLAYVIYTSGSTGRPKGVAIAHRSPVERVRWAGAVFSRRELSGVLAATSVCFDLSVFELFVPLSRGGRVILVADALELPRLGPAAEVTLLNTVPSAMAGLLEGELPPALVTVNLAGEPLTPALADRIQGRPGVKRLWNLYGPSEDTTYSTACRVPPGAGRVTIGRPLAATRARVVDRRLRPQPVGVPGELVLAGAGLARGYLGRPALTAERFLPDPAGTEPWGSRGPVHGHGGRLYRTGDLARLLPDGEIEFLGRLDHQVKLRGFRIELGEVEAALEALPEVSRAAAVVRDEQAGGPALVAYAVPAPGASPDARSLSQELAERLPAYMLPTLFVLLDELPRTPSGKVDRRALPAPERAPRSSSAPPRTPTEGRVAGLFRDLLEVREVGVEDSFFDLGGHSLLANRLVARLRRDLGVELPVRTLFEAPTVGALAARVDAALAAGRRRTLPPVERLPRDRPLPLSPAQERLWFLHRLEPESTAYNLPVAVRLTGALVPDRLAAALTAVVRRHEALRTTFAPGAEEPFQEGPVQQIAPPPARVPLPVIDLAGLAPAVARGEVRRLAGREARRPFDLARGPLLRAALLRLGETEQVLLLDLHHIVADGWSLGVLLSELGAGYGALARGAAPELPELPIQYPDYAAWQRRRLGPEELAPALDFWRRSLAGAPEALDLPTDRPRPAAPRHPGGVESFRLGPALSRRLEALARSHGATLFMVLLAGFDLLLARYTGADDLLVATPVAGREEVEAEGLIGLFVNTLVLRTRLAGAGSRGELLARVRETALAAFAHREMPFERLVEELAPVRDLTRPPLAQVMLVLQNAPLGPLQVPGLELEPLPVVTGGAKLDLTVTLQEAGAGLESFAEYDRELFDATTIRRLLGHFVRLLEGLAAAEETPLDALPVLTAAEGQALLVEWQGRGEPEWREGVLHRRVAEQVARTPEAVAVASEEGCLSYGGLLARARRLAGRLAARGVGPEVPVGISVDRSPALVVGLLGILEAGGAYVPLDPSYPHERLERMAGELMPDERGADGRLTGGLRGLGSSPVLLTVAALAGRWSGPARERLLLLDDPPEAGAARGETPAGPPAGPPLEPDNLAYVIYTSGSTGRPKGAMNSHRAIVNRLLWMQATYRLAPGDRVLQKTPASFDVSVWELFWPLLAGARLVLARPQGHKDGAYLRDLLAAAAVTTLHFVPSMLQAFLETPGVAPVPALARVMASGEALSRDLVRRFYARLGEGPALHNLYGPTEAAVDVSFRLCPADEERPSVPIGRPIANLSLLLLDRRGRPLPAGVPGELMIGGVGLARGYLGRPALTAERFVPHGLAAAPGERLYRTGDLARRLPEGEIDFLGRIDHQVKLRGFRIELGEIETLLRRQPAVAAAVVTLRPDAPGGDALVAYLVLRDRAGVSPPGSGRGTRLRRGFPPARGHSLAGGPPRRPSTPRPAPDPEIDSAVVPEALRRALARSLPDYMVPPFLVLLEALPLTPSGKVDRRALPAPAAAGAGDASRRPRTPAEEILAGLFGELLGRQGVGAGDSFFQLGGHSLLATRLVSRLQERLGVELPVRAVFEAPTVEALAGRLEGALGAGRREAPAAIPTLPRDRPPPLSPGQERLWFLARLEPESPAYSIPAAFRVEGELVVRVLAACLSQVARRHRVLRTTFPEVDGEPVVVVTPPVPRPLPVVDLSALPAGAGEELARALAVADARRPFDLARGPLARWCLLRCAPRRHVVLLDLHHIVADGGSMAVLVEEVNRLYRAFLRGAASPLPEPELQYADFAAWQRSRLAGGELERQLAFWRQALAGAPESLELPTDRPRLPLQSFRGAARRRLLPAPLTAGLAGRARHRGASPFMAYLAAFGALLGRWSGQREVVVGSPVANRDRRELEGLIGFFVNTFALRVDLSGEPGFGRLLERVRRVALGAYAHPDLPFELLVEELATRRELGRPALFQVMLVMQEAAGRGLDLPGLAVSPLAVPVVTTKFDLTLRVTEGPEGATDLLLEHSTDLFDGVTAERLLGHFQGLVEAALAAPDQAVAHLPFLPPAERHQVLVEAAAGGPAGDGTPVHRRFSRWVERAPDSPAVICEAELLSYGELARRARRLARRLQARGVGAGRRVGLCLERSAGMVTGLLGILEAGAAYVPLDPAFPPERLQGMLADAEVAAIVTGGPARGALPPAAGPLLLLAGEDAEESPATAWQPPEPSPRELVYVLFTSGSTGRPKGVAVEHRQLAAYVSGLLERLGRPAGWSWATVSTLAADLGNTSIFAALTTGGCLHVLAEERIADAEAMARYFARRRVDVLKIVPSHLAALQAPGRPVAPGRCLIVGGEAGRRELLARLAAARPGMTVVNHYGPTETTVGVVAGAVETAGPAAAGSVPLGRPLAGVEAYVVDRRGEAAPAAVPGELWIAGATVARGYLGRPAATAERFVPHPWGGPWVGPAGCRAYRTGDLVRWRRDGRLEFLGRIDGQVKIRGHRVEPAEVEAALLQHPAVAEAAVVARRRGEGPEAEVTLAAYVVAAGEGPAAESPLAGELRRHLEGRLPPAMLPAAFLFLDALPLTPNGKLDRQALPAPPEEAERPPAAGAPAGPVAAWLAELWGEVLGVPGVGPEDHFFELGGHSLLATRLISAVRRAFGVELPLRSLFEEPVLSRFAARVETAIQAGEGAGATPPVTPADRSAPLPLSPAQERLWFLHQLDPASPVYNVPRALEVEGALDLAAWQRALGEIRRRHEVLRTTFPARRGEPVQRIVPPGGGGRLPVVDLTALPPAAGRACGLDLVEREAVRPFDLVAGPLLRAVLLRLAPRRHLFTLTLHHIVSDAWSAGVLVGEMAVLYRAFRGEARERARGDGAASRDVAASLLPPLPVQYADFAVWQRRRLSGELLERELEHWRRCLAGAPATLELPTDRPRPGRPSGRGGARSTLLTAAAVDALAAFSRRRGATLYMGLLAAFQALLHRWTGQRDLVLGTPIAGRVRSELEPLVGFFVNTLVLRTGVAGELPFAELVDRVREVSLAAYAHQELPFDKLVEELAPRRDPAVSPLVQVVFVLQSSPVEELDLPGLTVTHLPVEESTAKFDLTLSLAPAAGGDLAATLVFNRDLFDPSTAARLLAQLRRLLEAAAAEPGRRLEELPLLGAGERHQLVAEWADTATPYPRQATVHGLFARQAAARPAAVAAVLDEEHLSYGELARRARSLAGRLADEGVGLETLVGLYAGRSVALLVGMLATLEAGGAYLPLDPGYPQERLALMLEDGGAGVVLVEAELAGRLPASGVRLLPLTAGGETVRPGEGTEAAAAPPGTPGSSATEILAVAGPENLAYVMYTSGSTGRPKGVAVTHRSIVRLVRETGYMDFGPEEVWLQLAPFSFDAATLEIWGALLHGARLVAPGGPVAGLAEIGDALLRHRVTALWLTAGLFHQMVESELASLAPVRQLLAGGDVLAPEWVKEALAARPGRRLVNGYGPTENTTFTCCHSMSRPQEVGWTVSLGRPIANGWVFVTGESLAPVGIGAPGELLAGGAGLARGYHRRPGLTAERFIPDPLGVRPGDRLYRTGDRVRWLADGRLEFLGRIDHQVKLRGFRVEPGEVEAALGLHPRLAQVAVVVAGGGGDKLLAAYYVPRLSASAGEEEALTPADLRAFLRRRLPAYMVPTAWVEMDELPLSPNGKVDRSALPAPDPAAAAAEVEHVPPRSSLEELLVEIWQEILGVERVGVHDNFFDLGGHSLKATQVVAQVREALGVELPLVNLLENPTVAELAVAVVDSLVEELGEEVFAEILEEAEAPEPEPESSRAG